MKVFKVKTNAGYFFTTSNGRYGRFGNYQDGFRYCQECAEKIVASFVGLGLEPEIEHVTFSYPCQNLKCTAVPQEE